MKKDRSVTAVKPWFALLLPILFYRSRQPFVAHAGYRFVLFLFTLYTA